MEIKASIFSETRIRRVCVQRKYPPKTKVERQAVACELKCCRGARSEYGWILLSPTAWNAKMCTEWWNTTP